ncbi:hypothetical protein Gotri_027995 [Gossypium trilobum]|uniref:Uncharacterized protein n=1 Tax=Gossypium trilobum TaxID=34281 RepID=A0A7J9FTQ8_9ROSI|nr:hypothetical protein [Gossypium trilobum]
MGRMHSRGLLPTSPFILTWFAVRVFPHLLCPTRGLHQVG